jgi:hypothetical protein
MKSLVAGMVFPIFSAKRAFAADDRSAYFTPAAFKRPLRGRRTTGC